jgi:hypothetical protein
MGNDGYNFGRIPEEEGLWGINRWETRKGWPCSFPWFAQDLTSKSRNVVAIKGMSEL